MFINTTMPGEFSINFGCIKYDDNKVIKSIKLIDGNWLPEVCLYKYLNNIKNPLFLNPIININKNYIDIEMKRYISLEQYITKDLPEEIRVKFIFQIIAAIRFLHHHKIYHRDIKPSNILVDDKGNIKIIDFGISFRSITDKSKKIKHICTYTYRPIELFTGKNICYDKIDIWTIGLVILFILTGKTVYYDIGKDEDELEKYFKFSSEEDYFKTFYDILDKTQLKYKRTYWSWVKSMLYEEPIKRININGIYKKIYNFINFNEIIDISKYDDPDYNINIFIDEDIYTTETEISEDNEKLVFDIYSYISKYKENNRLLFNMDSYMNYVKYFINKKIIDYRNHESFAYALAIIINIIIYDDIHSLFKMIYVWIPESKNKTIIQNIFSIIRSHLDVIYIRPLFKY